MTNGTILKPMPIGPGIDTDGDGISDRRERSLGLTASNNDTDADGDGKLDGEGVLTTAFRCTAGPVGVTSST